MSAEIYLLDSTSLVITLLTNANLSADIFSSVKSSLAANAKDNLSVSSSIASDAEQLELVVSIFGLNATEQSCADFDSKARDNACCLHAAYRRFTRFVSNIPFEDYILPADAVFVLKENSACRPLRNDCER